jgi:hypothetical protein
LTAWVATTGKPLRVVNIDDWNELGAKRQGNDPELIHKKSPCEIDDVGPFLAAPIKEGNDVIGVIRIPRRKESKPFEEIDEELVVAIADQLALTIGNIRNRKLLNDMRESRTQHFRRILSPNLIEACQNISELDCAAQIREFLESADKHDSIGEAILNSLESLWVHKYGQRYNFPLLKDFRRYEETLFQLPGYRDHFIHQYQVFLLGTVIIDGLNKISKKKGTRTFSQVYHKSLNISVEDTEVADAAWLITSTFHDIAYTIQRGDDLFNMFFDKFMGLGEKVVDRIELDKIISDHHYAKLIDQLSDFYCCLKKGKSQWVYNPSDTSTISVDDNFRTALLRSLLEYRDHGVLGALILLHQSDASRKEYSSVIYPSALAISLHKDLLFEMHDDIVFERNPLAFLLRYCDLVQEWGRGEENMLQAPELKNIAVYYGDDSRIHVETKTSLGNEKLAREKSKEARQVLGKLSSEEIRVELTIEENGLESHSKTP